MILFFPVSIHSFHRTFIEHFECSGHRTSKYIPYLPLALISHWEETDAASKHITMVGGGGADSSK